MMPAFAHLQVYEAVLELLHALACAEASAPPVLRMLCLQGQSLAPLLDAPLEAAASPTVRPPLLAAHLMRQDVCPFMQLRRCARLGCTSRRCKQSVRYWPCRGVSHVNTKFRKVLCAST